MVVCEQRKADARLAQQVASRWRRKQRACNCAIGATKNGPTAILGAQTQPPPPPPPLLNNPSLPRLRPLLVCRTWKWCSSTSCVCLISHVPSRH